MMGKDLENSLRETIVKSDLPSVILGFGEIAFDSILNDGVIKEIPVLGTFLAVGKTWRSIRDYIFAKKIMLFLRSISSLSRRERQSLIHKLDNDQAFRRSAGEALIEILSRVDGNIKPLYVASALKLYAREEITSPDLQRINNAIDRFLLCDLDELRLLCTGNTPSTTSNPALASIINSGLGYVASGWGAGGVHATDIAPLFIRVVDEACI